MVVDVTRNIVPLKLAQAVDRFAAEIDAIGYVQTVDATVSSGRASFLTWKDPIGDHIAFRDAEGWYEYERV